MIYTKSNELGLVVEDIKNEELGGKTVKFNGAICRFNNDILIAYRSYCEQDGKMKVFITRLNDDFSVKDYNHTMLTLYSPVGSQNFEDPRLFIHKGKLHCSYVNVIPNRGGWGTLIIVARLHDDLSLDHIIWSKNIGSNLHGTEKNWIFFSHEDALYFIYDQGCNHIYRINDNTGKKVEEYHPGNRLRIMEGYIRGGTSVCDYGDKYLVFYHGSDHRAWLGRTYYMGALEFEKKIPFRITRATTPFYFGSSDNEYCGSGNSYCVFPAGVIRNAKNDGFNVSAGMNDTYNCIMDIKDSFLEERFNNYQDMLEVKPKYYVVNGPMFRSDNYNLIKKSGVSGCTGTMVVNNHDSYSLIRLSSCKEISLDEFNRLNNSIK